MSTVSTILADKGTDVWHTSPTGTVYDALRLMADKGIGALLVLDGEHIAGIFSERDYARKVVLQGKSSRATPISEVMTSHVVVVNPEDTLEECLTVMTQGKFRHLPVVKEGQVHGIISIGDVVKHMLDHKQFMIDQLESYIKGH